MKDADKNLTCAILMFHFNVENHCEVIMMTEFAK